MAKPEIPSSRDLSGKGVSETKSYQGQTSGLGWVRGHILRGTIRLLNLCRRNSPTFSSGKRFNPLDSTRTVENDQLPT